MDIKGKAILLGGVSAAERGGEPYVYRRRRAAALRPPGLYPRGDGDAGRAGPKRAAATRTRFGARVPSAAATRWEPGRLCNRGSGRPLQGSTGACSPPLRPPLGQAASPRHPPPSPPRTFSWARLRRFWTFLAKMPVFMSAMAGGGGSGVGEGG